MGFFRQGYWSLYSFPSPGDLPKPWIEPGSPALQANSLPSKPPGKPTVNLHSKAKAFNNYLLGTICTLEIPFEVPFALWKKSYVQPRQQIKKQRHYFANKGQCSQSYSFSSGHLWIWELDNKESWAPKNWCFWTVVLEMTLESPLDCKEIKPVHPKGNQSWIFTEGLMLKLKLQYFGHLMRRTD